MDGIGSFFQGKAALVTGASSGIGEELAWQLAQAGAVVTLSARRTPLLGGLARRIEESGKRRPLIVECDVTRDGDLERAVAETVREFGKLDVAVANAGFGVSGPLKELSLGDYRRQFETNVFGVLRTIYASLPEIEKTKGNLVIIGSIAGWMPMPGASAYGMSKFALRSLASSIAPELRPLGIKVTLISPGWVASNFGRVDNQGKPRDRNPNPPPQLFVMPAAKAARQILNAVARGKDEEIITGHGKVAVFLERFAPSALHAVTRKIAELRKARA
ncbi:MAG TPA: SDR family NAD(P)-dependent oxidoreductase [Terriglobia bacterium]|jgi:short-subunit dehydrogenase